MTSRISQSEHDLFKAITSRPDEQLTNQGLLKVAGPKKVLPRRKVRAMDHSVLGKVVRDLAKMDVNPHGGMSGRGAFDNLDMTDAPSPVAAAARETQRKKTTYPITPHHGGTPADQPPVAWGIGQPQRPQTTTITQPSRAPGHSTYFHQPPQQPQSANSGKATGGGDDLRKFRDIHTHGRMELSVEDLAALSSECKL